MVQSNSNVAPERPVVVIAGGGIAGLYCAWELGRHGGFSVTLLETREDLGGRIESGELDGFIAEYGPMRFEPGIQQRFVDLCREVGIYDELLAFPEMTPEPVEWPKYNLAPDEEGLSTLGLLRMGVLEMFEEAREEAGIEDAEAWLAGLTDDDFEHLRRHATLNGIDLWRRGFWNALSEVLSHQAVMKIRDTGTFYHLIPANPSAVEWGIFWLRLFKPEGKRLMTVPPELGGAGVIVERLARKIESECGERVTLHTRQEVRSVRHGREGRAILLEVVDRASGREYRLEADHVILALPQKPLEKLHEFFPDYIRSDLEEVVAFPLLKTFLVTTKPWWPPEQRMKPQRGAGAIPTREVHYNLSEDGTKGMVMLYTDYPATEYWRYFVDDPDHHERAEVYTTDGAENAPLKSALVRYLLEQGQKERATRRAVRESAQYVGTAKLMEEVRELQSHPEAASLAMALLRVIEQDPALQAAGDEVRALEEDLRAITEFAASITAYSIRDWSQEPFGAAVHAWRPRAKSWEVREHLKAFGLVGRENVKNLHICNEAYSDYQGYIEGSLRSAVDALATLGLEIPAVGEQPRPPLTPAADIPGAPSADIMRA